MLIRVLWVFCVSLSARRLHFHINARLFGMMLSSSCCSVLVHVFLEVRSSCSVSPVCVSHTAEELGITASFPCPSSSLPPSTAWLNPCPSLAHALLCNAGLLCTAVHTSETWGLFHEETGFFPLPKMSFNYIDCSRRELTMFSSPLSHGRGLCCCQQSLCDAVGLNFPPARWRLEVHLCRWYSW